MRRFSLAGRRVYGNSNLRMELTHLRCGGFMGCTLAAGVGDQTNDLHVMGATAPPLPPGGFQKHAKSSRTEKAENT